MANRYWWYETLAQSNQYQTIFPLLSPCIPVSQVSRTMSIILCIACICVLIYLMLSDRVMLTPCKVCCLAICVVYHVFCFCHSAPEILNYEPLSCASDMWSVGAMTYAL